MGECRSFLFDARFERMGFRSDVNRGFVKYRKQFALATSTSIAEYVASPAKFVQHSAIGIEFIGEWGANIPDWVRRKYAVTKFV